MTPSISATVRSYKPAEATASVNRINANLVRSLPGGPSAITLNLTPSAAMLEQGFQVTARRENLFEASINPDILNRGPFIDAFSSFFDIPGQALQQLQDQLWLDGKLEFAMRDIPWIQNTDLSVGDLYDPKTRLVVGLGKVRGSASYEGFWRNAYANSDLPDVQAVFANAGIRMIPIPVQMETEADRADMKRILPAILCDRRISRIALTVPVKVDAVDTGLFTRWDPDTLPTGAVNTAAIEETENGGRYFVGRSTDGEGTVARIIEALGQLHKSLANSRVGLIGLGGFGRAFLGKILMNPQAPQNINIVEADVAYDNAVLALERIRQAYRAARGAEQDSKINIRIDRLSAFEKMRNNHPLAGVDVLVDATPVGMDREETSLFHLDFINSGMAVFHAAYRTAAGETRVPPILRKAYERGAIVHNGLSDWVGHQWLQVVEDLKRASGLRPEMPEWRNPQWDAYGVRVRDAAIHWADTTKGLKDAMAGLSPRII